MSDRFPAVPTDLLEAGGWTLVDRSTETVFELPTARVEGHTALYEDRELADALAAATDGTLDTGRFFFATRLHFQPPLAPGIGPASIRPSVVTEARRKFAADLEQRGFVDVERRRRERTRTDTGDRMTLFTYTARYPGEDHVLDVEGWVGVWVHDGEFRVGGGAYPVGGLPALPDDVAPSRTSAQNELLDLLQATE